MNTFYRRWLTYTTSSKVGFVMCLIMVPFDWIHWIRIQRGLNPLVQCSVAITPCSLLQPATTLINIVGFRDAGCMTHGPTNAIKLALWRMRHKQQAPCVSDGRQRRHAHAVHIIARVKTRLHVMREFPWSHKLSRQVNRSAIIWYLHRRP